MRLSLTCSKLIGVEGCPGLGSVQLRRISQGYGRLGPYGGRVHVCNIWSKDRLDDWEVVKEVFMVLICLSIKPFDLGYKGDEVMWSIAWDDKNCKKGTDEKGGPLSEKKNV